MNQNRAPSRIIRLLGLNALVGAAFGASCVALALAFDFAGIARLIGAGREPGAALALLAGGFAATFAALSAATAVMLIPERERETREGGGRLIPIPVRVPARGRVQRRP